LNSKKRAFNGKKINSRDKMCKKEAKAKLQIAQIKRPKKGFLQKWFNLPFSLERL
jgi:hypothetical protein